MKKFLITIIILWVCLIVYTQENVSPKEQQIPKIEHTIMSCPKESVPNRIQVTTSPSQTVSTEIETSSVNNPYKSILAKKQFSFHFISFIRGICGIAIIIFIAWLFSTNKKKIQWITVGKSLVLQLTIAIAVLMIPAVQAIFEAMGKGFVSVLDWAKVGSEFLFGDLMDTNQFGFIFVLQILPTIIFFSALTSLLFYLGILQKVVWIMGWLLTKLMQLSGAESLSCAGNIFLGQTEAPLLIKEYIPRMNKSEIMLIMTSGMATMAGGVLAAYIAMLGGGNKLMEIEFAKHLLSASVMAAPGAIAISKIIVPQTEPIYHSVEVQSEKIGKNILDAISNGTIDGLRLAANIGAMLLVFYAFIAGFNFIFGKIGEIFFINEWIASATDGRFSTLSFDFILSYLFYPIIWLIGIDHADLPLVGRLLGEKLILTEFIGYQSLASMIQSGAFVSVKSIILATYILCGFANFASIGVQIGGIGEMAPTIRHILSQYAFRSLLAATLVALMSASMIGMFLT